MQVSETMPLTMSTLVSGTGMARTNGARTMISPANVDNEYCMADGNNVIMSEDFRPREVLAYFWATVVLCYI